MAFIDRAGTISLRLLARITGRRRILPRAERIRVRTFRAALIYGETSRWPAVIRDYSRFGIRLETAALLSRGDHVVVEIAGHGNIAGVVRWCSNRSVGISLSRALSADLNSVAR